MKNLIIILIILALVVGAYRFVSSRKKRGEKPVEIIETEMTPTPTLATPKEPEQPGQDLPSAGGSSEEKPTLSPKELEKIIREFKSQE